jgi:hypothetical protein
MAAYNDLLFNDSENEDNEAGLEKNPGFKKNQPSGFFLVFWFFGFFIYLPRRESF